MKFEQIATEIVQLLEKKNHDYGDSNLEIAGLYGIAVRIMDKVSRLAHLCFEEARVDETVEDTLRDIAGYAINALRLINEGRLKPFGFWKEVN